jgi:hypothetical protein
MHQDIGILLGGRLYLKGFHKNRLVLLVKLFQRNALGSGHELPHDPVMLRTMGKNQQLVLCMEFD